MQRNAFGKGRIRFGADSSGNPLAYRPGQLLIMTPMAAGDAVPETADAAFSRLAPNAAKENLPTCRISGQLDDGWLVLEWDIPFPQPGPSAASAMTTPSKEPETNAPQTPPDLLYLDPQEVASELRDKHDDWAVQLNHVYSVDSLRAAPNYVAPNYVAPNYVAPNYVAPNYVAPNYVAPNYVAPNYVAPNYVAPLGRLTGSHGNGCACYERPEPPDSDRTVPRITARKAWGPLPGPEPVKIPVDCAEIHVLDVRPQVRIPSTFTAADTYVAERDDDPERAFESYRNDLESYQRNLTDQLVKFASRADLQNLIAQEGALLPKACFVDDSGPPAEDDEMDEARQKAVAEYIIEPASGGFGANVDDDGFVDPTTNHAEFIKGIIDRLVLDADGKSIVKQHAVVGTLGDIDDAHLTKAIDYIRTKSESQPTGAVRIMNLSLSGYNEDDRPGPVLAAAIARLQKDGWLVVASAGNNGSCRLAYPAALPDVVSVAAYGPCGPAGFSNFGVWVDACAPGVDIVSEFPNIEAPGLQVTGDTDAEVFDTGYASWSGTSYSAPFVAAKIARWVGTKAEDQPPADAMSAALDDLILDPDAPQIPHYGTIVGLENVKVKVQRESDS